MVKSCFYVGFCHMRACQAWGSRASSNFLALTSCFAIPSTDKDTLSRLYNFASKASELDSKL